MTPRRMFRGVSDSYKQLPDFWKGDMEYGFPARIKAVREDGVSLWYLPSDEVEHDRIKAEHREERLVTLIHDMYHALGREKAEWFEDRMEALGIEVEW